MGPPRAQTQSERECIFVKSCWFSPALEIANRDRSGRYLVSAGFGPLLRTERAKARTTGCVKLVRKKYIL